MGTNITLWTKFYHAHPIYTQPNDSKLHENIVNKTLAKMFFSIYSPPQHQNHTMCSLEWKKMLKKTKQNPTYTKLTKKERIYTKNKKYLTYKKKRKEDKKKRKEGKMDRSNQVECSIHPNSIKSSSRIRNWLAENQTLHIFRTWQLQKLLQPLIIHFELHSNLRIFDFHYTIGKNMWNNIWICPSRPQFSQKR